MSVLTLVIFQAPLGGRGAKACFTNKTGITSILNLEKSFQIANKIARNFKRLFIRYKMAKNVTSIIVIFMI